MFAKDSSYVVTKDMEEGGGFLLLWELMDTTEEESIRHVERCDPIKIGVSHWSLGAFDREAVRHKLSMDVGNKRKCKFHQSVLLSFGEYRIYSREEAKELYDYLLT